jgi:hypothetical protein
MLVLLMKTFAKEIVKKIGRSRVAGDSVAGQGVSEISPAISAAAE